MRILVTGISGYVGRHLADTLAAQHHDVRGLARDPRRVAAPYPVCAVDLADGDGLDEALDAIEVAYYLVHSMEGTVDYANAERQAAERFAQAAVRAGVRRIVYMSVLAPLGEHASGHVRSRLAVEQALAATGVEVVVLRASIVIGADSRSFRFLLHLVERLPLLPLPPWRNNRTVPIDERDLLRQLVEAADAPLAASPAIVDAVGPETVTYHSLIDRISDHLMVRRVVVPIPVAATAIAAPIAAAVSGEDLGLVAPLMQSLGSDLLARPADAQGAALGPARYTLDAAIEHALRANDDLGD
ncbi:MAG: NAD-dependent epimerase/dehydratase family protein [Patulibacter sp.]